MALTNNASPASFVPEFSTNSIWVDNDVNLCLTDKLTSMETSIGGKADSAHTHSGYAEANHTHNGYATADHSHEGYAEATHTHSEYAGTSHTHDYAPSTHTHSEYASSTHSHDYAATNHTHDYAASNHSHNVATTSAKGYMSAGDKSKLDGIATGANKTTVDSALSASSTNPVQNKVIKAALDGKAASSHTHDYAASNHTHAYLPTAGGDLTGNLNVNGGVIKAKNAQVIYNNGSRATFGGGNLETYAVGTKLYCNQAWSVASDERLKENIAEVDVDKCAEFIKNMDVKTFNYIGNEAPCIGVIAQDVEASELGEYFVSKGEDGYLAVKASDLVFPLIATVQKLQKEIEELKNK